MRSVSKDMTQPVAADGQSIGEAVTGLPVTLKKILSLFVLPLLNSVMGEQPTFAVVSEGPRPIVVGSMTPTSTAMTQSALTVVVPVLWVLHVYINPELFAEE
jgi:uncharacterized membrane protein